MENHSSDKTNDKNQHHIGSRYGIFMNNEQTKPVLIKWESCVIGFGGIFICTNSIKKYK